MKNTFIYKEVHSAAVITRIILPTFFEFLILFAVPIIDIMFLTHVNKNLISVFAIFSTLASIAVLHAQNFSNISVGALYAKGTVSHSYVYIAAGTIGIACFYISMYVLFANTLLLFGGIRIVTDSMRIYFILMVLSLAFTWFDNAYTHTKSTDAI